MQKINLRYGRAHLVAKDIEECRNSLEGLIIAPYDPAKARGIGYNLSLSEMIYYKKKIGSDLSRGSGNIFLFTSKRNCAGIIT